MPSSPVAELLQVFVRFVDLQREAHLKMYAMERALFETASTEKIELAQHYVQLKNQLISGALLPESERWLESIREIKSTISELRRSIALDEE